ncbi:MAG: signal transduction histidine kinase, partial [Saprospiraceae bacterium]
DLDTNLGTMIFNDKLLFAAFVRDITAQKAAQQELEHRLKFKRLLATLSTQFLNLSLEGIDEGIDEALKAICEFTDFDRSFVVLFSEEHKTCSAFYEWNRQGINANIDHFQNIPFKFFPGLIKKLKNNEYVLLKTNNDLLPEAEAFNTILQNLNIQSVMYAPMTWQGEVLGFIGFDSERVVKDWPEDLVILLRFAGEMIINILHRKKEKRALIASEQQLSIIYNNSIDYIGLIRVYPNNKFIIESINQPAQHFLKSATGIKSDDIIGVEISSLLKMFFTDTRPKVEQMMYNIRRVAKEKKNFIFQDHLPSPLSSNKKTYETAISPILKDDLCVQVLYVVKDITKEAKAKDKLIASEKHLKSIFDGSTDQMAILTINAYGELIFEDTNKSFKTAWVKANYGLDLESVYGKNLTYFLGEVLGFSEEKTKEYLQYSKLVTSQKKTINIEGNYLMMNNKKYFLDITITAILNEENICTKLLLVIRDNTLKHRAKENMIFKILETEDRERSRFAKELHDSLGQNLTAASLTFNQVKKSTDELSPDTRKSFETGIKFLKEAIDESRNIAHNLMPQAIKDFGYVLAVEGLLEDLSQTTGIEFTFYNNLNDERLSSDHELSLFRITQEAIQNILKHAEATKVTIQLIKHIDSIILSIEDNGKGFDSKTLKTKSFGLNSMKARSSALSGVIDIDGFPGKGVLITLEIPITALSQ